MPFGYGNAAIPIFFKLKKKYLSTGDIKGYCYANLTEAPNKQGRYAR